MTYDFRHMYAHFRSRGLPAAPGAVERLTSLLTHPPRPFWTFAEETAAGWR